MKLKPLGKIAILLRSLATRRYQPERHYMRGPGPACLRRQGKRANAAFAMEECR